MISLRAADDDVPVAAYIIPTTSFPFFLTGVGFVVDIKGLKTHSTVTQALQALENLDHRGAVGSDGLTGDGVGLLTQVPHLFFRKKLRSRGVDVAADTDLAVGVFFFPGSGIADGAASRTDALIQIVDATLAEAGLEKLMWRTVSTRDADPSSSAVSSAPVSHLLLSSYSPSFAGAHRYVFSRCGCGAQPA